jgi:hypothetical protein
MLSGMTTVTARKGDDEPPRYRTYYSIFTRGRAKMPYLDTTPYVPQGLTYWPEQNAMIVSYYDDGGGNQLIRYAKSDLAESPDGVEVARDDDYAVPVSSFVEISGDKLYVGLFDADREGTAHRYTLDADETPHHDNHSIAIPSNVQGMAVTPEHYIWSRSFGQEADSELAVARFRGRPAGRSPHRTCRRTWPS